MGTDSRLLRASLLACALLPASGAAQFPVYTIDGDGPGDFLGSGVAGVGDVNGDGLDDFAVGASSDDDGGQNAGSASVYSGTGPLLHRFDGSNANENYGSTVAGDGDVNNDGFDDVAVGAPFYQGIGPIQGRVEVRSGLDGSVIWNLEGINAFSLFGDTIVLSADVDNDSFADVIVGASNDDGAANDSGIVYVYSGATGSLLYQRSGDNALDQLGYSLAHAGDVNNDGIDDWIAGAPFADTPGSNAGHARVFSGSTGAVLFAKNGTATDDNFGRSVAGAGDINLDGRDDFAVGAMRDDTGGTNAGSVVIYSGLNGNVLRRYDGQPGAFFGASMANAGDYDGDGRDDLVIGSLFEGSTGTVRVYSGANGTLLAIVQNTTAAIGDEVGGNFDVNNDGRDEFIVGSRTATSSAGEATVFSSVSLLGFAYCFGDGTGGTCPCLNTGGPGEGCANSTGSGGKVAAQGTPSVVADDLAFDAENLLPGQPALLFAGVNAVNGGNGVGFGDGLRCAGGGVVRLGVRFPNPQGEASWGPGLAATGGWNAGDVRRFQVWYRNPTGSPCGSNFNLSNGFEVSFLP